MLTIPGRPLTGQFKRHIVASPRIRVHIILQPALFLPLVLAIERLARASLEPALGVVESEQVDSYHLEQLVGAEAHGGHVDRQVGSEATHVRLRLVQICNSDGVVVLRNNKSSWQQWK